MITTPFPTSAITTTPNRVLFTLGSLQRDLVGLVALEIWQKERAVPP